MSLQVTDKQVREAIAGLIEAAQADAKVYPRWIQDPEPGQWAALLRSASYGNKIKAWLISRSAIERVSGGTKGWDNFWSYRVWFFLQYETGNDTINSEDLLELAVNAAQTAISESKRLGLDRKFVVGHENLQFPVIDIFPFGSVLAHVAQGTLRVRITEFNQQIISS